MPRQISRYRKLAEVVALDSRGRKQRARALRIGIRATGSFEHIVHANDRLDHLAARYYREPRKWWRICDANPEFLSPLALLGSEPIVTARLPLVITDPETTPPFNDLLRRLRAINGVESVSLEDTSQLLPLRRPAEGVTVQGEQIAWTLVLVSNHLLVSAAQLSMVIEAAGFIPAHPQPVTRLGKPIVIPPDVIG